MSDLFMSVALFMMGFIGGIGAILPAYLNEAVKRKRQMKLYF